MNFDHSHKRARDAGEQAASLPDWDQRYEQLSAGRFEGEVDELRVGPAQVFAERANQVVMQAGHLSPHRMSIALVRAADAPGWYCGHRLPGEHLIGISAQGDFDLVASAGMQILALSVDTQALRTLAAQLDGPGAEDLHPDEKLLTTTEEVRRWNAIAVITGSNAVPHFFPGVKVETFHGFDAGKPRHIYIRGFFDLYCTTGPRDTAQFKAIADKVRAALA